MRPRIRSTSWEPSAARAPAHVRPRSMGASPCVTVQGEIVLETVLIDEVPVSRTLALPVAVQSLVVDHLPDGGRTRSQTPCRNSDGCGLQSRAHSAEPLTPGREAHTWLPGKREGDMSGSSERPAFLMVASRVRSDRPSWNVLARSGRPCLLPVPAAVCFAGSSRAPRHM
jgi:hypothetical protein